MNSLNGPQSSFGTQQKQTIYDTRIFLMFQTQCLCRNFEKKIIYNKLTPELSFDKFLNKGSKYRLKDLNPNQPYY